MKMLKRIKQNIMLAAAILTTIIDKGNEFSDAQVFTALGDTTSTKSFDTKGADIGTGETLHLVIQVDAAVTAALAATVEFKYVESDTADLAAPTVLATSGLIAKATLVAGYPVMKMKIPANVKRYVGVIYNVGTGVLTTGSFSAFLCKDVQNAKTRCFPSGYVNY